MRLNNSPPPQIILWMQVVVYNANVERKVELNIKRFVLLWQEAPSAAKIQKVSHVNTDETT